MGLQLAADRSKPYVVSFHHHIIRHQMLYGMIKSKVNGDRNEGISIGYNKQ